MPMEILIMWGIWLGVGAFCGWIAGRVVTGSGFGLIGDFIIGILGSLIAGFLLPKFGVHLPAGLVGYILSSAFGGIVLLLGLSLLRQIF